MYIYIYAIYNNLHTITIIYIYIIYIMYPNSKDGNLRQRLEDVWLSRLPVDYVPCSVPPVSRDLNPYRQGEFGDGFRATIAEVTSKWIIIHLWLFLIIINMIVHITI